MLRIFRRNRCDDRCVFACILNDSLNASDEFTIRRKKVKIKTNPPVDAPAINTATMKKTEGDGRGGNAQLHTSVYFEWDLELCARTYIHISENPLDVSAIES